MKTTVLLAAALVPAFFLTQATGTASVAVIDFDRAVADTTEGREAIAKLRAYGTERQAAIETKVKETNELQNRIRNQSLTLSEDARTRLNKDLDTAVTELESMRNDAESQLDRMTQDLLGPVEKKTASAVNAYAAERGLRIVLNASVLGNGLVYVHDTADITSEILRRVALDIQIQGPRSASMMLPPSASNPDHKLHSRWLDGRLLRREFLTEASPAD